MGAQPSFRFIQTHCLDSTNRPITQVRLIAAELALAAGELTVAEDLALQLAAAQHAPAWQLAAQLAAPSMWPPPAVKEKPDEQQQSEGQQDESQQDEQAQEQLEEECKEEEGASVCASDDAGSEADVAADAATDAAADQPGSPARSSSSSSSSSGSGGEDDGSSLTECSRADSGGLNGGSSSSGEVAGGSSNAGSTAAALAVADAAQTPEAPATPTREAWPGALQAREAEEKLPPVQQLPREQKKEAMGPARQQAAARPPKPRSRMRQEARLTLLAFAARHCPVDRLPALTDHLLCCQAAASMAADAASSCSSGPGQSDMQPADDQGSADLGVLPLAGASARRELHFKLACESVMGVADGEGALSFGLPSLGDAPLLLGSLLATGDTAQVEQRLTAALGSVGGGEQEAGGCGAAPASFAPLQRLLTVGAAAQLLLALAPGSSPAAAATAATAVALRRHLLQLPVSELAAAVGRLRRGSEIGEGRLAAAEAADRHLRRLERAAEGRRVRNALLQVDAARFVTGGSGIFVLHALSQSNTCISPLTNQLTNQSTRGRLLPPAGLPPARRQSRPAGRRRRLAGRRAGRRSAALRHPAAGLDLWRRRVERGHALCAGVSGRGAQPGRGAGAAGGRAARDIAAVPSGGAGAAAVFGRLSHAAAGRDAPPGVGAGPAARCAASVPGPAAAAAT